MFWNYYHLFLPLLPLITYVICLKPVQFERQYDLFGLIVLILYIYFMNAVVAINDINDNLSKILLICHQSQFI